MKWVNIIIASVSLVVISSGIAQAMRDPTQPATLEDVSSSDLANTNGSAIIYSHLRKLAYINKHYYKIGDTVDGATITHIKPHQIILETENKTIALSVPNTTAVKSLHKETS